MSVFDYFKKINNGLIHCCLVNRNFQYFVMQVGQATERTKFDNNEQTELDIIELIKKFFALDFAYILDLITISSDEKFLFC